MQQAAFNLLEQSTVQSGSATVSDQACAVRRSAHPHTTPDNVCNHLAVGTCLEQVLELSNTLPKGVFDKYP